MFNNYGLSDLIIVLVVVIILFGGDKYPQLKKSLNKAIKDFQRTIKADERKK